MPEKARKGLGAKADVGFGSAPEVRRCGTVLYAPLVDENRLLKVPPSGLLRLTLPSSSARGALRRFYAVLQRVSLVGYYPQRIPRSLSTPPEPAIPPG